LETCCNAYSWVILARRTVRPTYVGFAVRIVVKQALMGNPNLVGPVALIAECNRDLFGQARAGLVPVVICSPFMVDFHVAGKGGCLLFGIDGGVSVVASDRGILPRRSTAAIGQVVVDGGDLDSDCSDFVCDPV